MPAPRRVARPGCEGIHTAASTTAARTGGPSGWRNPFPESTMSDGFSPDVVCTISTKYATLKMTPSKIDRDRSIAVCRPVNPCQEPVRCGSHSGDLCSVLNGRQMLFGEPCKLHQFRIPAVFEHVVHAGCRCHPMVFGPRPRQHV